MSDINTRREYYKYFQAMNTRWIDNDVYGHINNATYYTYFDTVCNGYLIDAGGFDIEQAPIVGFIVASSCQYLSPLKYPMTLDAGMRVNTMSRRSVEYGVGIFAEGESVAAAYGTFTHVFVNRATGKSVSIPDQIRSALQKVILDNTESV